MNEDLPQPLGSGVFPVWWPGPLPIRSDGAEEALPTITVVTPSFNQAGYLEAAIRSVLEQRYPRLDYYVIDGGSRDGSIDVIRHYAPHLAGWVSEPDQGQVHAIQKALTRAKGSWFNWINSDDLLAPGALWEIAMLSSDTDVVAGATQNFTQDSFSRRRKCRAFSASGFVRLPLGSPTRWHQPSIWLRTEALRTVGMRPEYHYRFDLDLLIRYLHAFPRVKYTDRLLAYFRLHDRSKSLAQGERFQAEHERILRDLIEDPRYASLREDAAQALKAIEWRAQLDEVQRDRSQSRLARAKRILEGARAFPGAWKIRATRDILAKILLRGG